MTFFAILLTRTYQKVNLKSSRYMALQEPWSLNWFTSLLKLVAGLVKHGKEALNQPNASKCAGLLLCREICYVCCTMHSRRRDVIFYDKKLPQIGGKLQWLYKRRVADIQKVWARHKNALCTLVAGKLSSEQFIILTSLRWAMTFSFYQCNKFLFIEIRSKPYSRSYKNILLQNKYYLI